MKALLIAPDTRFIDKVDITSLDDVEALIGFDTLASDAIGAEGDRLHFDEGCFLKGASGRFQIDTLIPVSGKGVIVGTADNGARLRDVVMSIDDLRRRIKYL